MPGNAPEQGLLLYRIGCGLAENKLFFSMLFSIQRKAVAPKEALNLADDKAKQERYMKAKV